jgi:hypothetical protein
MIKVINYSGIIRAKLYKIGSNYKIFDAFLDEGSWPDNKTLINLVDGADVNDPNRASLNSGGLVEYGDDENHRIVTVYN